MRLAIGKFPLRLGGRWLWNCRRDRITCLRDLARRSLFRGCRPELYPTLFLLGWLVSGDLKVRILTCGLKNGRVIDLDRLALLKDNTPETSALFYSTISFTAYPLNLRHRFLLAGKRGDLSAPLRYRKSYAKGFTKATTTTVSPAVDPPEVPTKTSCGAVKGIARAANGNVCTLPVATEIPVAMSPVPPIFVDVVPTPSTGVPPEIAVITRVLIFKRTLPVGSVPTLTKVSAPESVKRAARY
jgi:hypothetical protein